MTPEQRFAKAVYDGVNKLGDEILSESGASGVKVEITYTRYVGKRGKLIVKMKVTPDAKNERIGDGPTQPVGTTLQMEIEEILKKKMGGQS